MPYGLWLRVATTYMYKGPGLGFLVFAELIWRHIRQVSL